MTAVQERFAREYGMPDVAVREVVRRAQRAARCNERACNGDPHPKAKNPADKNECAELWEAEVSDETVKLADITRPFGFTAVVYTGLGPTLKRGKQFVEVPY